MLGLDPWHWSLVVAVVNQAQQIRAERDAALIEAVSKSTAQQTINELARAMK